MEMLQSFLFELALACIPLITVYLGKFIYAKWEETRSNIKNTEVQKTLDEVVEMVVNVVQATNQVMVDTLKSKGEFTQEAATEAFNKSKETALKMLSEEAASIIERTYGDVSVYIDTLIEATVRNLKK
jgi:mevalonate kinase